MADNAELLQRIELLESLITADYTAPEGPEYSFPVTGQGITLDQYRQMMRGMGTGVLMGREYPYTLVGHDTDAETNSKNTLILRVDLALGKAEAVIDGFYHRLTEDMELSFPPVTVSTTYHVCLTLDPAKDDDPSGPVSVQVYDGEPPATGGRKHIILATVRRQPSQLLSDATVTTLRPYVSPVVSAAKRAGLPAAEDVLFGTLGVARSDEGGGTGRIYQARGTGGWDDVLTTDWKNCSLRHSWTNHASYGTVQARIHQGRVEMRGTMVPGSWNNGLTVVQLPEGMHPDRQRPIHPHFVNAHVPMYVFANGGIQFASERTITEWVSFEGVSFSL